MATPHNRGKKGDFAKTVLMPGDPLRAKYIAEQFLERAVLVNDVRGINGYTGYYRGKRVSVMASGMGMPSIGIYSHELFTEYDVETILRVGTAGGLTRNVAVRDVVFAMGACTDSNYQYTFRLNGTFAPIADYETLARGVDCAKAKGLSYRVGNVISSDLFYGDATSSLDWAKMGVLAVEMESAALYMNAARLGKKALTILTVSDNVVTEEELTALERERSLNDMIELALEVAE